MSNHHHESDRAVINRISRASGHLDAVKRMVEDGRDCAEILIQLSAIRSAINSIGRIILQDHIEHCIVDALNSGDTDTIVELKDAIAKFLK